MSSDRKYKIIATRNGPNDYSFDLEALSGGPPDLVFNKNTDKMKKRAYYALQFHLHNNSGCDLEFIDDRANVFSACSEQNSVDGCAPPGSSYHPIVYLHPTLPLGKKLIHVINTDPDVEKFYFGFSFVSSDGTENAYFDPGGDNQDRGGDRSNWGYALVGAVSGAVCAIGAVSLVSALNPPDALLFGAGGAFVGLIIGFVLKRI